MSAGSDRSQLAAAFDRAAPSYDAMVGLSPGYHDQLRGAGQALADGVLGAARPGPANPNPAEGPAPVRLLDLGCGSGASTRALVAAVDAQLTGGGPARRPGAALRLVGVDASAGMLSQARSKAWPPGVEFVRDDALRHLHGLPDRSVDGVLAAYLVRNVDDRDALLEQVHRVLRPGGVLVVHDYSVAGSRRAEVVWAVVCHAVIIPLAYLKRSDTGLHRYLYRSVRQFDSVPRLVARLTQAGFLDVTHRSYRGWQDGLVHTVTARRPA